MFDFGPAGRNRRPLRGSTRPECCGTNRGALAKFHWKFNARDYNRSVNRVWSVLVTGAGRGIGKRLAIGFADAGARVGLLARSRAELDLAKIEIEQAKKNTGKEPKEFVVGYDALAIYVHKDNPLDEITLDQIAQIYGEGGTITKWSGLGVKIPGSSGDQIVLVSRQSNSGTYEFLREHVLNKKDFRLGSRDMNGSKEVVGLVASTPTAIGYSGMGYATPGVKMLKVKKTPADPAFEPNVANTLAKTYPIARSLLVYTLGEPSGAVKAYIDWMLSDAGQKVVEASGYVPLPAAARVKP